MKLVVTGGGTGGHIYPALEVARLAEERGCEIVYLGSHRGQEGAICRQRGILFHGFPSQPLYSLATPRGWKAAMSILMATAQAKGALQALKPAAVFSTGGYSAAPVVRAARSLRIPYVIHEANSVPGRTNLMFASRATAVTCAFRKTLELLPQAVRTGNPIRRELISAALGRADQGDSVVVLGGSQGSAFLNETVPRAARLLPPGTPFLHSAGRANYDAVVAAASAGENYRIVPFLETQEILQAYVSSTVAVARSGSTVAEFALFGLPSVLVPLPSSAGNHQVANAKELADIGGATMVEQRDASPERLAEALAGWLDDPDRRAAARTALQSWSVPNATETIVNILMGVPALQ